MIPKPYIAQWQQQASWKEMFQIEQDLLISRILVAIFSDDFLRENLAFRGGTALFKLYLKPAPRYSEDIDLVQIKPGPIKPLLQKINEVVTFFEEERSTDIREHGARIYYPFLSEYEGIHLKIKIEINTKEHYNALGLQSVTYAMENEWYSGKSNITTYSLSEMLGTKIRAIYQRRKGRDLFDLYYTQNKMVLNIEEIIYCYKYYMQLSNANHLPSSRVFLNNLTEKENNVDFRKDMDALLLPEVAYNIDEAIKWFKNVIIPVL